MFLDHFLSLTKNGNFMSNLFFAIFPVLPLNHINFSITKCDIYVKCIFATFLFLTFLNHIFYCQFVYEIEFTKQITNHNISKSLTLTQKIHDDRTTLCFIINCLPKLCVLIQCIVICLCIHWMPELSLKSIWL